MRALHCELDKAVAAQYGWSGIDLEHDFHDTKQGVRYMLSQSARRSVVGCLLALNHERYDEERRADAMIKKVRPGLTAGPRDKRKGQGNSAQDALFVSEDVE
jgi:hypothetical protein